MHAALLYSKLVMFYLLVLTLATDKYFLGNVGKEDCPGGSKINDISTCQKACNELKIPVKQLKDGDICFKDREGNCYQNGKNGGGAAFVCTKGTIVPKIVVSV